MSARTKRDVRDLERRAATLLRRSEPPTLSSDQIERLYQTGKWNDTHVRAIDRTHGSELLAHVTAFAAAKCRSREAGNPPHDRHYYALDIASEIVSYPPDERVPGTLLEAMNLCSSVPLSTGRSPRNEFQRRNRYDEVLARVLVRRLGGVDGIAAREALHADRSRMG